MTPHEISAYLSAALDQEACRETLKAALVSRVVSLRARGIPDFTVCQCLENLCHDAYQLNADTIIEVVAWMSNGDVA